LHRVEHVVAYVLRREKIKKAHQVATRAQEFLQTQPWDNAAAKQLTGVSG
jgi:hypothetical protein